MDDGQHMVPVRDHVEPMLQMRLVHVLILLLLEDERHAHDLQLNLVPLVVKM